MAVFRRLQLAVESAARLSRFVDEVIEECWPVRVGGPTSRRGLAHRGLVPRFARSVGCLSWFPPDEASRDARAARRKVSPPERRAHYFVRGSLDIKPAYFVRGSLGIKPAYFVRGSLGIKRGSLGIKPRLLHPRSRGSVPK